MRGLPPYSEYRQFTSARTPHSGASQEVGSIGALYDLLVQAGIDTPVDGNQDGSYVTMKSNQGLVFGAATILSGMSRSPWIKEC